MESVVRYKNSTKNSIRCIGEEGCGVTNISRVWCAHRWYFKTFEKSRTIIVWLLLKESRR